MTKIKSDVRYIAGTRDGKFISKEKHEINYQKRRKKLGKKTYGKKYKTEK